MTSFNIYEYTTQVHIDKFKPTFLYIKRHTITGKLYFGKTCKTGKDFDVYNGSGTYWQNHIKLHGKEYVETIWFCYFTEIEPLVKFAVDFSINNKIIESENWANSIIETGLGGCDKGINKGRIPYNKGKPKPECEKLKISLNKTGKPNGHLGLKRQVSTKENMSIAHKSIDRTSKEYLENQEIANLKRQKSISEEWLKCRSRDSVKEIEQLLLKYNLKCKEVNLCSNWRRYNDEKLSRYLPKIKEIAYLKFDELSKAT